jgi:hypothetical protein
MNFFRHKDLGNHLLQLCPKVVKHPVYAGHVKLSAEVSQLITHAVFKLNVICTTALSECIPQGSKKIMLNWDYREDDKRTVHPIVVTAALCAEWCAVWHGHGGGLDCLPL